MRNGNFTSSEIVALTEGVKGFIDAGYTYIEECNMERRLSKALNDEASAKPLSWGKFVEQIAFGKLPLNYRLISRDTIVHPKYGCWVGTPDGDTIDTVTDIKSPYTRKSFCQLVQPLYDGLTGIEAMNAVRNGYTDAKGFKHKKHRDGDKFYFQLVSNSILTDKEYAELIVYMPYQRDLDFIREETANYDGDQNKLAWIQFATDDDLPHLVNDGYYKDLNIIRFKVPQEDKDFLTSRVEMASKYLIDAKAH